MLALNRAWKTREARRKIHVPGRMQAGNAWMDVTLLNVSSRGLLVQARSSPQRGAYIEIRRHASVIVGRVVWTSDDLFGVRTQDRIDIDRLLSSTAVRPADGAAPNADRRVASDRNAPLKPADRLERSRRIASTLQFATLAITALAAATLLAMTVNEKLAAPLHTIEAHLAGRT